MKYLKFSILAVTLLALAAGSAQAQECIVKAASANVRAEGVTEMAGMITLRCRGSRAGTGLGFGNTAPTKLEIAVTLNADITNDRDENDMIVNMDDDAADTDGSETMAGYKDEEVVLTALALGTDEATTGDELDGNFGGGAVSDDLQTVTWKVIDTTGSTEGITDELTAFQLAPVAAGGTPAAGNAGFELKIAGLRADASGVGDGGEIMATVKVNGTAVGTPVKVAGVMNGLDPVVTAAKGKECDKIENAMAKVTIKEGNRYSFMQEDSFLITLRNVPEGVTVMVPEMVGLATNDPNTNANEENESFILELVEGTPGDGVGKPEGGMAMVELSATGTGEVRYTIGMIEDAVQTAGADTPNDATDDTFADGPSVSTDNYVEWQNLPIYFSWAAGAVTMNADAMVYVSFHPVGGGTTPRFVGASDGNMPLTIEDCVTMLTFPFVSSASGYDTGIVVSNTKDGSGSCTASYSGSDDVMTSPMIEGNSHWIFLVSTHMQDYTGRLEVECDFGGIDGYAQINDHMGNANGYLPRGDF